MCVTNTTYRRSAPISLAPPTQQKPSNADQQSGPPSGLTQRLMGTFQLAAPVKPQEFVSTSFPQHQQYPVAGAAAAAATTTTCSGLPTNNGKPRPKRRRKPQKPGKTAKMNDRHFVVHNYHDHALDQEEAYQHEDDEDSHGRRKGGVSVAFPLKLHAILDQVEQDGLAHVISWQPHGRCFVIHQPKVFVETVMPKYFRQTKLTSFQRQLNLYGFARLTRGNDAGGYYHELFLRNKPFLTSKMTRTKVKGTKFKAASSPDQEPDFYSMPPVVISPAASPHASPVHQSQQLLSDDSISEAPVPPQAPPVNDFIQSFFNQRQTTVPEPYPFQFGNPTGSGAAAQPPPLQIQPTTLPPQQIQLAPAAQIPQPAQASTQSLDPADRVLDEAVEELFMDGGTDALGDLDDFVRDWDPNNTFAQSLENDTQLGYMLDCLLED